MTTNTTKTEKVITALEGGAELTAKQITARYGVANPRAVISSLRMQGYPVFLNQQPQQSEVPCQGDTCYKSHRSCWYAG
jgi:hypothetical protein